MSGNRSRIDIIGQNGPTGDHYEKEDCFPCAHFINDHGIPTCTIKLSHIPFERCDQFLEETGSVSRLDRGHRALGYE